MDCSSVAETWELSVLPDVYCVIIGSWKGPNLGNGDGGINLWITNESFAFKKGDIICEFYLNKTAT